MKKNNRLVMITGSNGSIGRDVVDKLSKSGYEILGIDLHEKSLTKNLSKYVSLDLNRICIDRDYREVKINEIKKHMNITNLYSLINIAGKQNKVINSIEGDISLLKESMNINCISLYILAENFKDLLTQNNGCLINIGSIHTQLTKKNFLHYSTSKGALNSLTKALSLEYGGNIKVFGVNPAAVDTEMLKEGFSDNEKYQALNRYHPSKKICKVNEISDLINFLLGSPIEFLHGSIIDMSGGISHCLNDPDNC